MSIKITFFILLITFGAVLVTILKNSLSTQNDLNNLYKPNSTSVQKDNVKIGESMDNLLYFIHLSDIHLSVHFDKGRADDLESFCRDIIPVVNASLLVLTGDITDSRTRDPMGSRPYIEEWNSYRHIHTTCMKYNPKLVWLDIRGNHDNFNVYGSENAYYKNYTVQGNMTKDGTSYRYEHKTEDGNLYSFIGIDACLNPGIKRPFNFIGKFYPSELKKIKALKDESRNSNYTIWFGHYPTSAIINANDIRPVINGPYLCGHYHNLHGLAKHMVSTQPEGYLEAEVADWKDSRIFRIAVIDNGLFTFEDYSYQHIKEQPLIVITNPRKVIYQMEHLEPYWRTAQSTHIRVLVFSKVKISNVRVSITDQKSITDTTLLYSIDMKQAQGSLWVTEWNPSEYSKGIYYIHVEATDILHNSKKVTNAFSLDQTKPDYTVLGRMIIRIQFPYYGMFLYVILMLLCLTPLLGFRLFSLNDYNYNRRMFNLSRRSFSRKFMFKFYLLSHIDALFFPLVFIPIYVTIGPWFLGYYVTDHIGVSFLWGSIVDWKYLPVGFTYIFAFITLFVFHVPFLLGISEVVHNRYIQAVQKSTDQQRASKCSKICNYFVLLKTLVISIAILLAITSTIYYFAYGLMALTFNVFTFTSITYLLIISAAIRLNAENFPLTKNNPPSELSRRLLGN